MNMVHLIFAMTLSSSCSAIPLGDPFWKPATKEELKLVNPKERVVKAKQKAYFICDFPALKAKLEKSPLRNSPEAKQKNYFVTFPWPDGSLITCAVSRLPGTTGFSFAGASIKDSGTTIKGVVTSTFMTATAHSPTIKHDVLIAVAAPTKHCLYGVFVFVPEEQSGK